MTNKQFEELEIGDLVTTYTGPNKGLIMKVVRTFIHTNTGKTVIVVEGVNEEDYIHSRSLFYRDGHHTSGSVSSFKIIRKKSQRKSGEGKTMHRSGRPSIDNPRTFQYRLRLNAEEEKQLTFLAKELNKPKSEIIRELIRSASHTLYYGYDAKTGGDDADD